MGEVVPMIIEAYSDKSEADAWDKFYSEFQGTPGKKIWRSTPTCESRVSLDTGVEQWRVRARVFEVNEIPDGMEEATARGPYPAAEFGAWRVVGEV